MYVCIYMYEWESLEKQIGVFRKWFSDIRMQMNLWSKKKSTL